MKLRKKQSERESLAKVRKGLYRRPQLMTLFFELTDACNMACLHCGSHASSKNHRYLSSAAVKSVLDEVAEAYDSSEILVCFTGGEPLLHPELFELVAYTTAKGFGCGMTTNGTLVTDKEAALMRKSGIRSVSVSLDGMRESHDLLRGRTGSYDSAVRGIGAILAVGGIYTQITGVFHKRNINELDGALDTAVALGVHSFRAVCIDPIGRALDNKELLLDGEGHRRLLDFIRRKREEMADIIDITYGCSHYLPSEYEGKVRDHSFFCGAGLTVAGVLCNGDIFACLDIVRLDRLIQGNVERDSFVSVWENGFAEFRRDRSELCGKCSECSESRYCAGDSAHTWDYENNKPLLCLKDI